jgi:glycosyltransferase involved in cell wall biosynthesis
MTTHNAAQMTFAAKPPGSAAETVPTMAVVIPCYNEEAAIAKVIADFRRELPDALIYVYDNNSTDKTADIARASGAIVSFEGRQGKGNVVRAMFQEIDADIYIMVDGDTTYPADRIHEMLKPVLEDRAEMVVGSRLLATDTEMKPLNRFGNELFRFGIRTIFGARLTDILSGYRVMTRDFVRSVTLLSEGFQIETELTIQALHQRMRIVEVPVRLTPRPSGGESKIRIVADGVKILFTIVDLFRTYKPLTTFGGLGLLALISGVLLGIRVVVEFVQTGLVLRMPTAVLATGLVISGFFGIAVGLILNTLSRSFKEVQYQMFAFEKRSRPTTRGGR